MNNTKNIIDQLVDSQYDCAVAIATDAEINAGAACGQIAIVCEEKVNS